MALNKSEFDVLREAIRKKRRAEEIIENIIGQKYRQKSISLNEFIESSIAFESSFKTRRTHKSKLWKIIHVAYVQPNPFMVGNCRYKYIRIVFNIPLNFQFMDKMIRYFKLFILKAKKAANVKKINRLHSNIIKNQKQIFNTHEADNPTAN